MTPQIIWLTLLAVNLVLAGYQHGKEKEGKHNVWISLFAMTLNVLLLSWGGFFDPLLK